MAASAFDELGYNLVDIGTGKDDPIDRAKNIGISYIAIVAPIDSEGSWWDGFFAFSMRITETVKRKIIWSAQGDFGQGGIFINQAKSTNEAMHKMVKDFSKTFPPKKRIESTLDHRQPPQHAVNRSKFAMNEYISQRMAGSNSALPPKACIADTAWTFVLRPVSIER